MTCLCRHTGEAQLQPIRNLGARREWLARRPGRLTPGKTHYPLHRTLGGTPERSGPALKVSNPTGIRFPDRLARSEAIIYIHKITYIILIGNLMGSYISSVDSRNIIKKDHISMVYCALFSIR
jgi:hypothetical protein